MKKINKTTIQKIIEAMTVVEMRKAAKDLGIKNAKQYKRPELSEKLFAAMMAKAEEEAKASTTKKAPKGSNKDTKADVEQAMAYLTDGSAKTDTIEYIKSILMAYGRTVLIRVMANLKVKGWYRIYDKYTMVDKIAEKVAA